MYIAPTGSPTSVQAPGGDLGRDQFLKLLVTQLRYQDPMSPMDSSQFSSQLAQFSTLEQLVRLNEQFEVQAQSNALMNLSINTALAASLVGRQVMAAGSLVSVSPEGEGTITVDVGGAGGRATLRLLDASGLEVGVYDMGAVGGGRQAIPLADLNLSQGVYSYELTVTGVGDMSVDVTSYVAGVVDGVQFADGGILLRVGGLTIPLRQLAEIEAAPTTGGSGN